MEVIGRIQPWAINFVVISKTLSTVQNVIRITVDVMKNKTDSLSDTIANGKSDSCIKFR